MADQREHHGVGGLENRARRGQPSDESLVTSTHENGEAVDVVGVDRTGQEEFHEDFYGDGFDLDECEQGRRTPLDMSALRADDALLTALGSADLTMSGVTVEPDLKALLLSWRQDVDAEPMAELVDIESAAHVIFRASRERRRRPRYLIPLASAAAVLVIVFTGMGLAARDAQPGDPLWGLTQMLYADHARSVEAAVAVRTELGHASEALQQGRFREAQTALALAQSSLPSVSSEDGKADLSQQRQSLLARLDATGGTPPATTPTGSVNAISPVLPAPASSSSASSTPPSSTSSSSSGSPSSSTSASSSAQTTADQPQSSSQAQPHDAGQQPGSSGGSSGTP